MIERQETKQRMSRIVKHNGTIYLCGQVCADATQGIKEQTQTMLDKVETLLEQAGSDKEHMLSATIYLKTMDDFQESERSMGRMGSRRSRTSSCLCNG